MRKYQLFLSAIVAIGVGVINYSSCKYPSYAIDQPRQTVCAPPPQNVNSVDSEGSEFIISIPSN